MADLEETSGRSAAAITLFASDSPAVIVQRATAIAEAIAPVIRSQHLVKRIGDSDHVYLEGWTLAGSMLGVFACTVRTWEIGEDAGYGATVEARTLAGAVVGRAEAIVMRDERVGGKQRWLNAPSFQLISMAQTRASSKALRMPLGFVMKLAGYDATPAEEMAEAAARGETVSGGKGVPKGWKDSHECDTAHDAAQARVKDLAAGEQVKTWMGEKSYRWPMAKGQLASLGKLLDRMDTERAKQTGAGESAGPDGGAAPAAGPAATTDDEQGQDQGGEPAGWEQPASGDGGGDG